MSNPSFSQWLGYFKKYPTLRSTSKRDEVIRTKRDARLAIIALVKEELKMDVTDLKVRKAFNNMKQRYTKSKYLLGNNK